MTGAIAGQIQIAQLHGCHGDVLMHQRRRGLVRGRAVIANGSQPDGVARVHRQDRYLAGQLRRFCAIAPKSASFIAGSQSQAAGLPQIGLPVRRFTTPGADDQKPGADDRKAGRPMLAQHLSQHLEAAVERGAGKDDLAALGDR